MLASFAKADASVLLEEIHCPMIPCSMIVNNNAFRSKLFTFSFFWQVVCAWIFDFKKKRKKEEKEGKKKKRKKERRMDDH